MKILFLNKHCSLNLLTIQIIGMNSRITMVNGSVLSNLIWVSWCLSLCEDWITCCSYCFTWGTLWDQYGFFQVLCLCDITILLFSCLFLLRPLESLVICFYRLTYTTWGVWYHLPVSISLLAKHGSDEFLLNLVETLYDTLKEEVDIVEKMGYWILSLPNILLFILYPTQRYKIRRKKKLLLAILCHIGSFFLKHLILQVALKCN